MTDTKTQLYVVNINFEGGTHGEVIEAEPALVADWLDSSFISPIDERGERVLVVEGPRGGVKELVDEGAQPIDIPDQPRRVTESDVNPGE